jgi:hypothetical protein
MQLSGSTFTLHEQGPGFNAQHLKNKKKARKKKVV